MSEIVRTYIPARFSVSRPCQLGRTLKEKRETRKKKNNQRRHIPEQINVEKMRGNKPQQLHLLIDCQENT